VRDKKEILMGREFNLQPIWFSFRFYLSPKNILWTLLAEKNVQGNFILITKIFQLRNHERF